MLSFLVFLFFLILQLSAINFIFDNIIKTHSNFRLKDLINTFQNIWMDYCFCFDKILTYGNSFKFDNTIFYIIKNENLLHFIMDLNLVVFDFFFYGFSVIPSFFYFFNPVKLFTIFLIFFYILLLLFYMLAYRSYFIFNSRQAMTGHWSCWHVMAPQYQTPSTQCPCKQYVYSTVDTRSANTDTKRTSDNGREW